MQYRIITNGYSETQVYFVGMEQDHTDGSYVPLQWTGTSPVTWVNGSQWVFHFSFPVQGWGSTNTHIITPAKSNLTDWKSYSLTSPLKLNSAQGVDSNGSLGQYRRVGDSIEVKFAVKYDGDGHSSAFTIALPDGLTFDTDKIPTVNADGTGYLGSCTWYNAGTGTSDMQVGYKSSTTIKVFGDHREIVSGHGSGVGDESTNELNSDRLANNDYISGTFTAPIAEWSAEDHNFLSALPMTKVQTKYLSSNVSGSGSLSDIEFNNLTEGKYYRLTVSIRLDYHNTDAENLGAISFQNGSQKIMQIDHRDFANDVMVPDKEWQTTVSTVFKCGATGTIIYNRDDWTSSDVIQGDGTYGKTYCVLEELNLHTEVDIW